MKHCCKNVVILMPEPVAEPALNGLRLNLRIVSIVMFNFASYLTIGLPLAVLPGYVHDVMGFSASGRIGYQPAIFRHLAEPSSCRTLRRFAGPQKDCRLRFMRLLFERSGYLTAGLTASLPVISLLLLCRTRDPWDWAKFCRNGIDPVGRWRGPARCISGE